MPRVSSERTLSLCVPDQSEMPGGDIALPSNRTMQANDEHIGVTIARKV